MTIADILMFVSKLVTAVFMWLLACKPSMVMHVFAATTFIHVVASMMIAVTT